MCAVVAVVVVVYGLRWWCMCRGCGGGDGGDGTSTDAIVSTTVSGGLPFIGCNEDEKGTTVTSSLTQICI